VQDAAPRTLYISRKLLNADEVIRWARGQGIETTLPAEDMHVTIALSRIPVDWMDVPRDWSTDEKGRYVIPPGGARLIERFDGGALVLLFKDEHFEWRHKSIRDAGEWALVEVGMSRMHPELITLMGRLKYRTSYGQNVLNHLVDTANIASMLASKLGVDPRPVKRAALLHHIGNALAPEHERSHPRRSAPDGRALRPRALRSCRGAGSRR